METSTLQNSLPSEVIEKLFDDEFGYIMEGDKKIDFSAERILIDLTESGISVVDALDILFIAREHIYQGIDVKKLTKILNKLIADHGYEKSYYIRGEMDPLIIEYGGHEELLTFNVLKKLINKELADYAYSMNTFQMIVNELYRLLKSIKVKRFDVKQIRNVLPSVVRSIIGINIFEPEDVESLYDDITNMFQTFDQEWNYIPDHEKGNLLINLCKEMLKLILLHFKFLPGHNLASTHSQVGSLSTELSKYPNSIIGEKDMYFIGKVSYQILQVQKNPDDLDLIHNFQWLKHVSKTYNITTKIVYRHSIQWLVIVDHKDREVYTKFSDVAPDKYRSLIGMAISGFQSLLNEVTDDQVNTIQQKDGVIVIERKEIFSVAIFLKNDLNEFFRRRIAKFATQIEKKLGDEIENFNGKVNKIREEVDPIVDEHLGIMF